MAATKTTRSRKGLSATDLRALNISPEVACYLTQYGYPREDGKPRKVTRAELAKLAPPAIKTPEPSSLKGATFDVERVDRVIRAFTKLQHTQGKWAGRPLVPDLWQVAYILAPVFGWTRYDPDAAKWVRIIRELYVDIPRKNGKSTLIGGIAVYMLAADGEPGAQCLTAATSKEQAGFVFAPVKAMVEKAPALRGHVQPLASSIIHQRTGSYFKPIANVADAQHGANIHLGAVDELHIHKKPDLVEVIETGMGSRDQPLLVMITTADDGKPNTIYNRKRDKIEKVARGTLKSPTTYGVIWCADKGDDPFSEATQRKANPGFGISPTRPYLESAADNAKSSPAVLSSYLRLHLGIRTKQRTQFIPLDAWSAQGNIQMVVEGKLKGRKCHGGLDLASVEDITALCWEFPNADGSFDALWRFWLPEARARDLSDRTARNSEDWIKQGLITLTPGNVIDQDFIEQQIVADVNNFDVQSLGYDRWGATTLVTHLNDKFPGPDGDGLCVPRGQGYASASAPLKDLLRLVLKGNYRHGGNPVMVWMTDNLAVAMDPAGNVKPDKASCAEKIDGWSAVVNAHGEFMDNAAVKAPEPQGATPAVLTVGNLRDDDYSGIETAGF
jgi:phage terminase large subunit-like protein